jgi:hypothetical protein
MSRYLLTVLAGLLLPVLGAAQCLTTLQPNPPFVPPIQYPPSAPANGTFWFGTDELWTALDIDGKWKMGDYGKGTVYRTKLVFWARGLTRARNWSPS